MKRAGRINRDQFYWAIIWVIPDRLVGVDLSVRRKFGAKVWIRGEKNKMAGENFTIRALTPVN